MGGHRGKRHGGMGGVQSMFVPPDVTLSEDKLY